MKREFDASNKNKDWMGQASFFMDGRIRHLFGVDYLHNKSLDWGGEK